MRGERGKFPSTWMSLSVKSIESWGCGRIVSYAWSREGRERGQ